MKREPSGKWNSTLEVSEKGLEIAKDDRGGYGSVLFDPRALVRVVPKNRNLIIIPAGQKSGVP